MSLCTIGELTVTCSWNVFELNSSFQINVYKKKEHFKIKFLPHFVPVSPAFLQVMFYRRSLRRTFSVEFVVAGSCREEAPGIS